MGPCSRAQLRTRQGRRRELYYAPLPRLPPIRLGTRAAHQHGPLGLAQALRHAERLDALLVIDDRKRARPVGAPQAAIETPGVEHARQRIPDVGIRIRLCDSVQAPLTLITAFLRLASSSTFGSSAHGCGGAGGTRGCRMPRWSMMKRVSGWRSISAVPASRLSQHMQVDRKVVAHGGARDAVEARVVGRAPVLLGQHDADADRARRLLPLGDDIGHVRIVRVDRLDDGEPVRDAPAAPPRHSWRHSGTAKTPR